MLILLQLFLVFIFIGVLNFGGGYAMVSFIQNQVVDIHGWISLQEYTDMLAISQATPGPIAVNTATYTGFKIGGVPGALIATLGIVVPAYFIILGLMHLMKANGENKLFQQVISGIRPMVVALIAGSAISMGFENVNSLYEAGLFGLAFVLLWKFKINPITLISIFGVWGVIVANVF